MFILHCSDDPPHPTKIHNLIHLLEQQQAKQHAESEGIENTAQVHFFRDLLCSRGIVVRIARRWHKALKLQSEERREESEARGEGHSS